MSGHRHHHGASHHIDTLTSTPEVGGHLLSYPYPVVRVAEAMIPEGVN